MFVELIDHLRCPEPHDDSWLVLHAEESRDRHVLAGILGCPVCGKRYVVKDGTVDFSGGTASGSSEAVAADAPVGDAWPLRLAAFLGLAEGGGAVALYGGWSLHAEALGDVAERVEPLAIAPPGPTHPMLSAIVPPSLERIPLATGSVRGVAMGLLATTDPSAAGAALGEAVRILRPAGRLLAPASLPLPHGVRELARDGEWWVAEREAGPSGIVSIGRATLRRA